MLIQDSKHDESPASHGAGPGRGTIVALMLAVLAVLVLRHDYWNWNTPGYLLFGFLPVGLWWQAGVSVLASVMMALMVRYAWPGKLEEEAVAAEKRKAGNREVGKQGTAQG